MSIKNQKGEVVTGTLIIVMVGVMLFGMIFMHGGHGSHGGHGCQETGSKEHMVAQEPDHSHHAQVHADDTEDLGGHGSHGGGQGCQETVNKEHMVAQGPDRSHHAQVRADDTEDPADGESKE